MEMSRARLAALTAALLVLAAGALSACGGGDAPPTSSGADTAASSGTAGSVVIAGVPSLESLYAGTESPPPATGPAAVKGKTIAWISCGQASQGCATPTAAAADAAKVLGWNFTMLDARLNAAGGLGTSIRQAIALKPDAIVTIGLDCEAAKQPLEDAKSVGIPVLGVLNLDCDATGSGPRLQPIPMVLNATSPTTQDFWRTYGGQKAAYIIHKTNGKARVIHMHSTDSLIDMHTGFVEMLAKCPDCKVVADLPNVTSEQGPTGKLTQQFSTALARNPDANAMQITADSLLIGSGLAQKMNSMPAAKSLVSVAGEGSAAAMALLRQPNGVPTAENGYDNDWLGWAAMDSINRFFANAPAAPQGLGSRLVDREHNMTAGGPYVSPIDFRKAYTAVWTGSGR